ncbi:MAG: hypothetical protein A4S09_07485 [Proteobacteria bacterium SG_bin7]|nr:MAG: hypothetical protein A4S09_07485 [Proteobacteria bacterium SG_bin7]
MKKIILSFVLLFAADVFANQTINVQGAGYYPDHYTADAVCAFRNLGRANGYTLWRQAGDVIEGLRSFDGRPYFQREVWRGGMALATVNCSYGGPISISVRNQGYYPDFLTARAVCVFKGMSDAVGFTQFRQAGDVIEGMRSFDGRPYFQREVWRGGMSLDAVNCR